MNYNCIATFNFQRLYKPIPIIFRFLWSENVLSLYVIACIPPLSSCLRQLKGVLVSPNKAEAIDFTRKTLTVLNGSKIPKPFEQLFSGQIQTRKLSTRYVCGNTWNNN